MSEDSKVVVERGPFEMVPHWLLHDLSVNALAIRLYLVLRQHADAQGTCFPSRQRLCDLLGVSLPTLDKARDQLVQAGAITIRSRKDSKNQWGSSLYIVHWDRQDFYARATKFFDRGHQETSIRTNTHLTKTSTTTNPLAMADDEQPGTMPDDGSPAPRDGGLGEVPRSGDLRVTEGSSMGPGHQEADMGSRPGSGPQIAPGKGGEIQVLPPGVSPDGGKRRRVNGTYPDSFEHFWRTYPRRAGKKNALAAWLVAIKEVDPQVILDAAARFANDPNREQRFTPHPATWLNQGRWDDEPLPPRSSGTAGQRKMELYQDIYQKINQRKGIEQ